MIDINRIYQPIKEELKEVEKILKRETASENDFISNLSKHILSAGGKKIRPALVLLSNKAVGEKNVQEAINLATSIEMFHTATLVLDDIIDKATIRRNKETINAKWGVDHAILFGDYLLSEALKLTFRTKSSQIHHLMIDVLNKVCEGQIEDFCFMNEIISEKDYLKMIEKKTASLIAMSCKAGAIISKASLDEIKMLENYGMNFGKAFQIMDDCKDFISNEAIEGKNLGSDLKQGKMTLPLIFLNNKKIFQEPRDLIKIKRLVKEKRTVNQAVLRAKEFAKKAKKSIVNLKDSPCKESLLELADAMIKIKVD